MAEREFDHHYQTLLWQIRCFVHELVRHVGDWFVDHGKSKQHTECMVHVPAKTQSNPAKSYAPIVSFLFTLSVLFSILIIVGSFEDDPDTGQD